MLNRSRDGEFFRDMVDGGVVWDNHICMPLNPGADRFLPQLERCFEAGVDLVTIPVGYDSRAIEDHVRMLALFRSFIARNPEKYQLVLSVEDIARARQTGKLGICFDIEGMNAVSEQPDMVRLYYDLGVRWMLIAYNRANGAGGGCLEDDHGLTSFGKKVISEMNQVGMVLCCTHAGYRTAREAIDFSFGPIIFSHSNPRSVWNHPRNIPDDLIVACAERGGVIGLNGIGIFLGENDASIDTFIRHVEHVLELVGDDHIGIGTDYAFDQDDVIQTILKSPEVFPPDLFPPGVGIAMIPPWHLVNVAKELADRGHSNDTVRKLFGGNLLRVARQVWK
ncbi:membrane dipeptidase [Paraburkholderia sp. Ac-20340]|uniref:dipeptidase n=1 Tax=Paraburkholderia sp. Ac-20340 TaxID=2703888 RepID=UPI00197F528C|nr:membrane dipeptidase [Paraburkholderia sp. Ac-20340]MBN3858914.1 membrane dipeptidase [Paraburkholderia sp. Ac-20340]